MIWLVLQKRICATNLVLITLELCQQMIQKPIQYSHVVDQVVNI
jgi:hypothetical protein